MSEKQPRDLYMTAVPFFNTALAFKYDRHVEGFHNIPEQPALYAINHLRFEDSLIVAGIVAKHIKRPLRFGAKSEYFEGMGLDNHGKLGPQVKWFMERTGQIRVQRDSDPRSFQQLSQDAAETFQRGDSLALHPEGSRSLDGRLNKFKSGVARIALQNHVPIIPTGLVYTSNEKFGERDDVDIMFGEPIMPEEYEKRPFSLLPMRQRADRLTHTLEERVATLTHQERSHEFARIEKRSKISDQSEATD